MRSVFFVKLHSTRWRIQSVSDLAGQTAVGYGVVAGGVTQEFCRTSTGPEYARTWGGGLRQSGRRYWDARHTAIQTGMRRKVVLQILARRCVHDVRALCDIYHISVDTLLKRSVHYLKTLFVHHFIS